MSSFKLWLHRPMISVYDDSTGPWHVLTYANNRERIKLLLSMLDLFSPMNHTRY